MNLSFSCDIPITQHRRFAVRLLLSVAVVYRFSHAENKSIFAQRYGPCTPPEGTKHTNVRRVGTKYKTIVKEVRDPLIPCGFSALAPLAEMRYTGKAETNVKERNSRSQNLTVLPVPSEREPLAWREGFLLHLNFNGGADGVRPLRHGLRCATSPKGRGKSSGGNFHITPDALATGFKPWLPLWGSWQSR